MNQANEHNIEVQRGDRFAFGENWAHFLSRLDESRVHQAELSLKSMLGVDSLEGKTFLDVGSGSGLFSLAARRMGARVTSFDFDPQSVACTAELKIRYFQEDPNWRVMTGSVLDQSLLAELGLFDVVYAWGVLHHTGQMWRACGNLAALVQARGILFISIYNDQGRWSKVWRWLKRSYNRLPRWGRYPYVLAVMGPRELRSLAFWTITGKPQVYFDNIRDYSTRSLRGMSYWHDLIDWIGGFPFEVAKPEEIFDFYLKRGFQLVRMKTCGGGLGCNEFVFVHHPVPHEAVSQ